jgi:hypothetical protein
MPTCAMRSAQVVRAGAKTVYWAWTAVCGASVLLAVLSLITTVVDQDVDYLYALNVTACSLWTLLVGGYTVALVRARP